MDLRRAGQRHPCDEPSSFLLHREVEALLPRWAPPSERTDYKATQARTTQRADPWHSLVAKHGLTPKSPKLKLAHVHTSVGSNGVYRSAIVRALDVAGVEVVAASRGGAGPHGIVLDRRNIDAVQKLVGERRVTTIIDLLAYTEIDTLPLLSALGGKIDRWVMTSSGDVYRNYEGFQRKSAPAPSGKATC